MRSARKQSESEMYHVVSRGTGRQLIFEDDTDRESFLELIKDCSHEFHVEILAWCLMGNHFHLLVQAPIESVSSFMHRLCGSYAQRFNGRHTRIGHLFQERYKSEPVEDEAYLATVVAYIHFNPERAGMGHYRTYPWSSYAEYSGVDGARQVSSKSLVMDYFGGPSGFSRYHEDHASAVKAMDVDLPRSATRSMSDEDAITLAEKVLNGRSLGDIKSLPRPERNDVLAKLLTAGLSVRQTERLTGISRGVIQELRGQKPDK